MKPYVPIKKLDELDTIVDKSERTERDQQVITTLRLAVNRLSGQFFKKNTAGKNVRVNSGNINA
jgi:hypothetical protein